MMSTVCCTFYFGGIVRVWLFFFFKQKTAYEMRISDWSSDVCSSDLMAAMLARAMADLEREQYELRAEGSVMTSERGTPVVNPRKTVVQMHAGTILSMRRSLSLHARAQQGEARDAGKRRAAAKEMEDQSPFGDDLIARPSIQ